MSFIKVIEALEKQLFKDPKLHKLFRGGALFRIGTTKAIDFQGCTDIDAVSATIIPMEEAELETDNTFDGPAHSPPGEGEVEYRMILRVRFEKSEKDRIEDERGVPGLLEITRLVKKAIGQDFSLGIKTLTGQRYPVVTYLRGPPIIAVDINVAFSENVVLKDRNE